ncbi:hypothetical protein T9A_01650 [Alcanivorax jadensis T9]|jgi:hypothetical protein|uniref:WbqC-like family protein n=1 Tax=Alcanivorax jadensis T9 TaxID=1177181 RepID=A0ABR4WCL8_9GAMM|nr:WbqC family protein [Alcanivorax jadensis]KGD61201.1 hypothetical protein T9A_01650 [Alcanivorax jadensis T9]MBP20869.1 hypothetical protein [Alcanivorax sp.]|tara:strand:+ start:1764 stop:2453 length:690 start_codon:yes stop_codon:yes gene_type:complete
MVLAVMQPYLFPYIGYFQLIFAADIFLVYDDVSFIKQGYINRNTILTEKGVKRFTVPVPGASSNKMICDLDFSRDVRKIKEMVRQSYSKAPYFDQVFPLICSILEYRERSIADLCIYSYQLIFDYLGIGKEMIKTSDIDYDRSVSARDKLISFCRTFSADSYINVPGGRALYSRSDFSERGISLKFIEPVDVVYFQGGDEFVPNLSIIDLLMNCSVSKVHELLRSYRLA